MQLEEKIRELERKLALKNGYLQVVIKFPKGNKIPSDVKEEISTKIKDYCLQIANDNEHIENFTSVFSEEEISILKELVSTVKGKTSNKPENHSLKSSKVSEVVPANKPALKIEKGRRGILMLLDNIDPTIRGKLAPQSMVVILENKNDSFFVETKGIRFWVPREDLDLI